MLTILDDPAYVGGSYSVEFTFKDEEGADLTPNTLTWTMTDSDGTVINSRSAVVITPAATVNVVLSGNDLVITDETDSGIRLVTMIGDYDSALGTGLPLKQVVEFVLMKGDPTLSSETLFDPYVTASEMETYFYTRLNVRAFDNASRTDRLKAAHMATKAIDRLNFHGNKASDSQTKEFPRGGDTTIPQDIKNACCEIVLVLLDGVDTNFEYDSLALISDTFLRAKTQRDTSMTQEHIVVGIPSRVAWQILKPYVRVPAGLTLHKTS